MYTNTYWQCYDGAYRRSLPSIFFVALVFCLCNMQGIQSTLSIVMGSEEQNDAGCDVINVNNRNGVTAPLVVTSHRIISPMFDQASYLPNRYVCLWKPQIFDIIRQYVLALRNTYIIAMYI